MQTILIIDQAFDSLNLASMLERDGYVALIAPGAQSAVALIAEGARIDLVVSELQLPDADGFEFLAWLRRIEPSMPVIVATSGWSIETYLRAMGLGVMEYLPKPLKIGELLRIVRMALASGTVSPGKPPDGAHSENHSWPAAS